MAASDEFPRGTVTSALNSAAVASITIPAVVGVSHVVTDVYGKLITSSVYGPIVSLSSASLGTIFLMQLVCPGTSDATDSDDASGLQLRAAPNEAVTIAFNAWIAGTTEFIRAQWYDI